jgi:uncharacterized protein YebE (UPF0316 family)
MLEYISNLFGSGFFALFIIPVLIFLARIVDVSLGTLRIIFVSKGLRYLAPILGFFEVLIWLVAIQQIITNLSNIYYYLAYAGGFAAGTYVGIILEEKISIGKVSIRIITGEDSKKLLKAMDKAKYTVTTIGASGHEGKVNLILSVTDRKDIPKIIEIVRKHNPNAFYSVEDIKFSMERVRRNKNKSRKFFGFDINRK